MTQTGLQGDQGFHSDAMPLPDLSAEVMALLEAQPQAEEIVVDRAKPLRFAERDGFDTMLQQYNDVRVRR